MRILVIPHDLNHLGGGSSVAAWTLQALVSHHEISVLTWEPADLRTTNRHFGTRLEQHDFRWFAIHPLWRLLLARMPFPLAHLKNQILYRRARRLNETERFDVVFGLINEVDVGVPALQYVHYPWAFWPRPAEDLRWYHLTPLVLAYRKAAARLSGYDARRVARNLTLVNSDWTADLFARWYGVRPLTVYPPVPGGFPAVPFEERALGFNCLGRISPEKRLIEIIRILAAVRERRHEVGLQIIGHVESESYRRQVIEAAAPHRAWISFHHDVPRDQMTRLVVRNRYAIHGMVDEHFGIGPAELQRAGCITFVPRSGGQLEIVGGDERLAYSSPEDAVEKICRVLDDAGLERELQRGVELRRERFSEERFMREVRMAVGSFASAPAFAGAQR